MLNLRENEKIVQIVRQHHSVMTGGISWAVIFAGLAVFFVFKFDFEILDYSWEIAAGFVVAAIILILYKIYVWRKNVLFITNQRIVISLRQSVFSRTVTELLYQDVYDISFKQSGLSSLINKFGKLIIKTPSGNEIIFDKVPTPDRVVEAVNNIRIHKHSDSRVAQSQNESR